MSNDTLKEAQYSRGTANGEGYSSKDGHCGYGYGYGHSVSDSGGYGIGIAEGSGGDLCDGLGDSPILERTGNFHDSRTEDYEVYWRNVHE